MQRSCKRIKNLINYVIKVSFCTVAGTTRSPNLHLALLPDVRLPAKPVPTTSTTWPPEVFVETDGEIDMIEAEMSKKYVAKKEDTPKITYT